MQRARCPRPRQGLTCERPHRSTSYVDRAACRPRATGDALRCGELRAQRRTLRLVGEIAMGAVAQGVEDRSRWGGAPAGPTAEAPQGRGRAVVPLERDGDPPLEAEDLAGAARGAGHRRIVDDELRAALAQRRPRRGAGLGGWRRTAQPRAEAGVAGDLPRHAAQDAATHEVDAGDVGDRVERQPAQRLEVRCALRGPGRWRTSSSRLCRGHRGRARWRAPRRSLRPSRDRGRSRASRRGCRSRRRRRRPRRRAGPPQASSAPAPCPPRARRRRRGRSRW